MNIHRVLAAFLLLAALNPRARADDPPLTLQQQVDKLEADHQIADTAAREEIEKTTDAAAREELIRRYKLDTPAYLHRLIDLAAAAPTDPAAREALILVLEHNGRFVGDPFPDETAQAAQMLATHFGDDPNAICYGLDLNNAVEESRDLLLRRFYASAKSHESKGLARLALAQYYQKKSQFATGTRKSDGRSKITLLGVPGPDGKPTRIDEDDKAYAYKLQLQQCDPEFLKARAIALYEEVIADYPDVPCLSRRMREWRAALAQPNPQLKGRPLTEEDRKQIQERLDHIPSLADTAKARLDDLQNLAIGKPAPEIEGKDLDGKTLKLSDHRGKVVLLVFWGTWCGPCMLQIPHERELTERFAGRPFTILGINCNDPLDAARAAAEKEHITWPNWLDGDSGPILSSYHVRGFPSSFLLDAQGVIRQRDTLPELLGDRIEQLVKQAEEAPKQP